MQLTGLCHLLGLKNTRKLSKRSKNPSKSWHIPIPSESDEYLYSMAQFAILVGNASSWCDYGHHCHSVKGAREQ